MMRRTLIVDGDAVAFEPLVAWLRQGGYTLEPSAGEGVQEYLVRLTRQAVSKWSNETIPAGATLQAMEKLVIAATLERTAGDMKQCAAALGINRSTLYEKIKKYGIPR